MYRLPSETLLRRVAYHGRLPFACPLACDVTDAAGVTHRASYVDGSMLDYGAARYTIDGATYELQRNGELRPVRTPGLCRRSMRPTPAAPRATAALPRI